jgi:hypothetical protein
VELQGQLRRLTRDGIGVTAISYDSVDILREFADRRGITFPLLSDDGSAVIKQYGLLNTTLKPGDRNYGIPFPGTFMLDAKARVTSRFFETAYQERATVSSILARLGSRSDPTGTIVSAPHLKIATFASDRTVAPGTHFSLVLDISPLDRVHVYAPGVTGYKPIALTITPQPGLIVRGSQFPKSEDYFFKPLNEHVRVYQRPFRIVQDLMFDASPASEAALKSIPSATIEGSLDYQACDDKVCFNPQSVPLSWTISLRPLDRERVKK